MPRLGLGIDLAVVLSGSGGSVGEPEPEPEPEPVWTPADLFTGGMQGFFLDPSNITTVLGTDGVTQVSGAEQVVGKIVDLSGNGNYATQTNVAKQPIYKVDENGKPYIYFNGTDEFMQFSLLSMFRNISGATMIAAVQWDTSPVSNSSIFCAISGLVNKTRTMIGGGVTLDKYGVGGRRNDADTAAYIASANVVTLASPIIQTGVLNYTSAVAKIRINAVDTPGYTSLLTPGLTSDTDSLYITIGSGGPTYYANIKLYGLFVTPTVLSDSDILLVENYFLPKIKVQNTRVDADGNTRVDSSGTIRVTI